MYGSPIIQIYPHTAQTNCVSHDWIPWKPPFYPLNYRNNDSFDFRFSKPMVIGSPNNFKSIDFGVADCKQRLPKANPARSRAELEVSRGA
jgi:hypothetical protein